MTSVVAGVLADADGWGRHMGWDGGWWMLIWGTVMMAGFIALIGWLVKSPPGGAGNHGVASEEPLASARRILAERYAQGELTTAEYRERLRELTADG